MSSRKKNILIICKGHQNIAGAQLYLKHIASLFPPSKYELHYAFHKNDGVRVFEEIARTNKVILWEYDWRHLTFLKSLSKAYCLIKKINPSLVLFNSTEDKILAPLWASFLAGLPNRVMVVHWSQTVEDLAIFHRRYGLPIPSRYALITRIIRGISYNLLDSIIFVNNITRKAYRHLYKVPSGNCRTIYNGIDTYIYEKAGNHRQKIRKELGIGTEEIFVLSTGNLTEVKGHKYLISAICRLCFAGIRVKCFIAGQGELELSLNDQIRSLGGENFIKMLGYRNDVSLLLSAADIFCMPSINEALPYSILEAMASGVPIIASNVGGIPEVITHGSEGILAKPQNIEDLFYAIADFSKDKNLRKRMGLQGRLTVQDKFTLGRMIRQTKEILMKNL